MAQLNDDDLREAERCLKERRALNGEMRQLRLRAAELSREAAEYAMAASGFTPGARVRDTYRGRLWVVDAGEVQSSHQDHVTVGSVRLKGRRIRKNGEPYKGQSHYIGLVYFDHPDLSTVELVELADDPTA